MTEARRGIVLRRAFLLETMDKSRNTVTIFGQEVEIKFNMGVLIGYEEITGTSFYGETFETTKTRYALVCAVLAQSDLGADVADKLLKEAGYKEFNEIFAAIMKAATEFFELPQVMEAEKEENKGAKN